MKKLAVFTTRLMLVLSLALSNFSFANDAKNKQLFLTIMETHDVGKVSFYMEYHEQNKQFTWYSGKGADTRLFGFFKGMLGRATGSNMVAGSMMHISGSVDGNHLSGTLLSALGTKQFVGEIQAEKVLGQFLNRDGSEYGTLSATPVNAAIKLRDYPKLVAAAIQKTEQSIYDKELMAQSEWKSFKKALLSQADTLADDLEMVSLFFYKAKKLPFSHFAILNLKTELAPKKVGPAKSLAKEASLTEHNASTAILNVPSFTVAADDIHKLMQQVIAKNYTNLIIDLRKNAGGNLEPAYALGSYLVKDELLIGHFLSRKWYDQDANVKKSGASTYASLVQNKSGSLTEFNQAIAESLGVSLVLTPAAQHFSGRLIVLTSAMSASTSEPFIYGLKRHLNATVVGEKTSGAMLSSQLIKLSDDFELVIPIADYITDDGKRLDQVGVEPNIFVPAEQAMDRAIALVEG